MSKWIIFDLDGTLADIEDRRQLCTKENGKMDWDKFFDPKNIKLDKPNQPVIDTLSAFAESGHCIAIMSGRSAATKDVTEDWLIDNGCCHEVLFMRPEKDFTPDEDLKLKWFNELFINDGIAEHAPYQESPNELVAVFDDRQKVVDMWREIGLTCMQVAPGKF